MKIYDRTLFGLGCFSTSPLILGVFGAPRLIEQGQGSVLLLIIVCGVVLLMAGIFLIRLSLKKLAWQSAKE